MNTNSGTNQISIKRRNMFLQVLLMFVTLGLYAFYWFYMTGKEMRSIVKTKNSSPELLTILLFVPFASLYSYYKHAELFQAISSERLPKWIIFILWIFFPPGVWFLVQMELNERADKPLNPTTTPTPEAIA